MNIFKLISATALVTVLMVSVASATQGQVVQQGQEQDFEADTDVSVTCTSGSYGQNLNCTADADTHVSGSQSQSQYVNLGGVNRRVAYRADGTPVYIHDPANTALDIQAMAVAAGTMLTGAAGAVIKIKSRA